MPDNNKSNWKYNDVDVSIVVSKYKYRTKEVRRIENKKCDLGNNSSYSCGKSVRLLIERAWIQGNSSKQTVLSFKLLLMRLSSHK